MRACTFAYIVIVEQHAPRFVLVDVLLALTLGLWLWPCHGDRAAARPRPLATIATTRVALLHLEGAAEAAVRCKRAEGGTRRERRASGSNHQRLRRLRPEDRDEAEHGEAPPRRGEHSVHGEKIDPADDKMSGMNEGDTQALELLRTTTSTIARKAQRARFR